MTTTHVGWVHPDDLHILPTHHHDHPDDGTPGQHRDCQPVYIADSHSTMERVGWWIGPHDGEHVHPDAIHRHDCVPNGRPCTPLYRFVTESS